MKRNFFLLIIISVLISTHFIQTRIGCLSKSKELKEEYDTKSYHPVQCTCDCAYHQAKGKLSTAQNQCLECGHSHDPKPLIIVTKIAHQAAEKNISIDEPKHALQSLINHYKAHNPSIGF